ncbi:MAG: D-alanine--D-alanine ligase, partial [Chloroflexi bacterium]|nr:D-alanine--D-alanine ligase [Chloroflexota bacterium]
LRLAARIRDTALAVWSAMECSGYARVDLRTKGEEIYVLELNPNPSLAPDAGFARATRAAGLDYAQMILRIVSFV